MKKTKILFIIWAIIVIIIVGLLTTMGFILKNRTIKYEKLESKLVESAEKYAYDKALLDEGEEMKITSEELILLKYLDSLEIDKDSCKGYVIIKNDGGYKYEPFISCHVYTTMNYEENK